MFCEMSYFVTFISDLILGEEGHIQTLVTNELQVKDMTFYLWHGEMTSLSVREDKFAQSGIVSPDSAGCLCRMG